MRKKTQQFDPRQNMRKQNFEIFHYQDARLAPVDVHHHDFYEVYFFLKGRVDYRVEGKIYHLEPGDLLLINPMELHQPMIEPGEPYERIVLWINKEYLEHFSSGNESLTRCFDTSLPTHTNLLHPTQSQRTNVMLRMGELVEESYTNDYCSELRCTGIFLQLMVDLNRIALGSENTRQEQEESSPLVTQVLAYIGEHYNEPLSLDWLAQHFFVSKYHLSHEFSHTVGTSVYRYITLKRLLIARQMLINGVSPGAVHVHCGFGDYTNFYRAFKAEYGISPRACANSEE